MFDWYGRPNKLELLTNLAVNARNWYFPLDIPLSEFGKAGTEGTMAHVDGGYVITTRFQNYSKFGEKASEKDEKGRPLPASITQSTLHQIASLLGQPIDDAVPITTIFVCSPSEDAGQKPSR